MTHQLTQVAKSVDRNSLTFTQRGTPSEPNKLTNWAIRLFAIWLLVGIGTVAQAQDIQHAKDTVDQKRRSRLTVDPSSLGLNLQIPLAAYAGRGGSSLPMALQYSSKVWHMEYGGHLGLNPHANGWVYPVFGGGWTSTLDAPSLGDTSMTMQFTSGGAPDCGVSCSPPHTYTYIIYRIQVRLPDGSTHEVRKNDSPVLVDGDHPADSSGTYYAVDGSQMRLEYHTGINVPPDVLYLPDGSRYIWNYDTNGYSLISYIDRNGNTLVYSQASRQWTDTMGRVIAAPLPVTPTVGDTAYTMPGLGSSTINYTLRWKRLSDVRTDINQPLRYLANYSQCDLETSISHSPSLFSTGTSCDADDYTNQLFNPVLLSEVVLPNGKSYKFTYNVFGELDKIIYPTGGYERFQHDTIPSLSYVRNFYAQGNRGVVDHWISVDGSGTDENEHHWHYQISYPNNTPPYKVTATAPDLTYTERYLYSSADRAPFKLEDVRVGRAYDERSYSAGGLMLRRTLTDWAVTGPMSGGQPSATRNPRVTKSVDLILDTGSDALARTTTYGYDTTYQFDVGIEQTSVNEYDYATVDQSTAQNGTSGSILPGSPVRTSEKSYLDGDSSYRSRNLLGLVTSARVKDGNGNIVAQSMISYDEAPFPLLTYGSVVGWNDPGTNVRGNATTSGSWLDSTGAYLQTHAQYDQCGSVRASWDAKGNQSQVEYSSTYAYAYPTLTRTAVPDPSGGYALTTSLVATSSYDFNTGLVTSTTDANGQTTSFEYVDALDRLTKVNLPDGGRTTYNYVDAHQCGAFVETKTLLDSSPERWTDSWQFFDGLGRPYLAESFDGQDPSNPYLRVDMKYDTMGRAWKVSSPYRSSGCTSPVNPSGRWTETTFDALGRPKQVTTPDSAVVTTDYSGNTVTVTDQAGKKRRSVTDGLGRLARVDEPDSNGNLGLTSAPAQPTSYTYDALGNLRKVDQGSQQRFFMYDSLSRLIRAKNPEQAAGSVASNMTDTITGNTQWSMAYGYDNNGNLTARVDARDVTSNYAYDALNRNYSTTYSDGTPTVHRYYDSATNGKGRLYWDEAVALSANVFDAYDAIGRPTQYRQRFWVNGAWGQSFNITRTYDKAGHVITQTNPSSHIVTYNYDTAGRLADKDASNLAFTGNLGDGVTRTYSRGISYSAFGGLSREQFGTDTPIYNKLFYNSRGQLAEIREGLTPNDTNWERGAIINFYGTCWGMCGGENSTTQMTDNNGNLKRQETYIPGGPIFAQTFAYDSLNRLQSASEDASWRQEYVYDRYGNRRIDPDPTKTYGAGINNKDFTVNTANNRLGVPSGQSGVMDYDPAGNLINDTYTGAGSRSYDAENRMTSAGTAGVSPAAYTYNADGQRVRRNIDGVETWQVYGMDGELLAEYAAGAAATAPQKEYGYRNGQLLVTAEAAITQNSSTQNIVWTNMVGVSASGNSLTKTAATAWGNAGAASTQTISSGDGYVEMTVSELGTARIFGFSHADSSQNWDTIDFGLHCSDHSDNAIYVYESGSERGTFGPYAVGDKLRVAIVGGVVKYSRNGTVFYTSTVAPTYPLLVDTALYENGATLTNGIVSGNLSGATQSIVWRNMVGVSASGNSLTKTAATAWGNAGAASTQTISSGDGYVEMTVSELGTARIFGFSHADSSQSWDTIDFGLHCSDHSDNAIYVYESGSERGTFGPYAVGDKLRVAIVGGVVKYSRNGTVFYTSTVAPTYPLLVDTALYENGATLTNGIVSGNLGGGSTDLRWLVMDQLGTPRMIFDKTGSLAATKRHDYLPFGGELFATQGLRTMSLGYSAADGVRQKFTQKERDIETGLDYFGARYFSSNQGRFTSPDSFAGSGLNPQSLNRYSYAVNDPVNLSDPTGHYAERGEDRGKRPELNLDNLNPLISSRWTQDPIKQKVPQGASQQPQHTTDADGYDEDNVIRTDSAWPWPNDVIKISAEPLFPNTIYIWKRSWHEVRSVEGHVTAGLGGLMYSWEQGGWRKPFPTIEQYLKENSWRSADVYVIDFHNADMNAAFREGIKKGYDNVDNGIVLPTMGGYNLIQNNCGEGFCRTVNSMGLPRDNGITPAQHKEYIETYLQPYIVKHYTVP